MGVRGKDHRRKKEKGPQKRPVVRRETRLHRKMISDERRSCPFAFGSG